jgi:DNA-directed RNA polymerase specialized sigma24 family protein
VPDPAFILQKLTLGSAATVVDSLDTELLHQYVTHHDEAAFAELVRRNGPSVLRTCRQVLGEASADDAFQAVFLLLARSAGRFTRPGSLAGWLHAVAHRIALKARRADSRRRRRESSRPITNRFASGR